MYQSLDHMQLSQINDILYNISYINIMNFEAESKNSIKSFEFKKFNKSLTNYYFIDPLSEYFFKFFPETITTNLISTLSFFTIFLAYIIISLTNVSRLSYLVMAIFLFVYQMLDNINQKQAIRRGETSLLTVFIDHLCDSLSCSFIVLSMSKLFQFSNITSWFALLLFSLVPYYVDHINIYYSEKLQLGIINPVDDGVLLLQLICWISVIVGQKFYLHEMFGGLMRVHTLLFIILMIPLTVYLIISVKSILFHNNNPHEMSLKNLLLIFIIGYTFLELAVLNYEIFESNLIFNFLSFSFILINTITISRLLINLASIKKFNQLSIDTLLITVGTIIFCSISYLNNVEVEIKINLAKVYSIVLFVFSLAYFLYFTIKTIKNISQILQD